MVTLLKLPPHKGTTPWPLPQLCHISQFRVNISAHLPYINLNPSSHHHRGPPLLVKLLVVHALVTLLRLSVHMGGFVRSEWEKVIDKNARSLSRGPFRRKHSRTCMWYTISHVRSHLLIHRGHAYAYAFVCAIVGVCVHVIACKSIGTDTHQLTHQAPQ
jgi:hypothetical protein